MGRIRRLFAMRLENNRGDHIDVTFLVKNGVDSWWNSCSNWSCCFFTGLSVIASLILVLFFKDKQLEARVYGYYGVWMVCALVIYIYLLLNGKSFNISYLRFALPISVPLIVHTLANTLLSTSDRVMINRICGAEATALYAVAYSCAMVVSILWTAINQAWAPWCFEMMHQKKEKEIGIISRPILLLFSMAVIAIILIAPEILLIMGGEKYKYAVNVIPPVMLGFIAQMLYTLYVNIESYNKKQKQIMLTRFEPNEEVTEESENET